MVLLVASGALAERRVALVVGANSGWAADRPLRFAHDDARRMRDVLVELGQFAPQDTTVLLEPTTRELTAALDRLDAQLAAEREPTLFYFFYSGHADATALHLRGPVLEVQALADRLAASKAALTLAVVDACRSGAILGTKGAAPVKVSTVRMQADEPVQGFALLSSSGVDELAQESRALAGSLFTHHWISALRGAGDLDGDGVVQLSEAYGYAYDRTRIDAEAAALPQRPGFRFSLKGQGDVPLTRLTPTAATLELEAEESRRYVVVDDRSERLVAEARSQPGQRLRLQLAAGVYQVKRPGPAGIDVASLTLTAGAARWASQLEYRTEPVEAGFVKGGETVREWAASGRLADGDVDAAVAMFQRILDEDPHEERARKGKARALLLRSVSLYEQGDQQGEMKALQEALSLDPTLGDDPSVARFAERSKVLAAALERQKVVKEVAREEVRLNPRLGRRWGLGAQLISTKGILVLEGYFLPLWWLCFSLSTDLIGPGLDAAVKVTPLPSTWSPFVSGGFHYGFNAWQRGSSISVNGMPSGLAYDDIWGTMFHAEVGLQWMSRSGFSVEFGGGPMLFFNKRVGVWQGFGFANLGISWYFR